MRVPCESCSGCGDRELADHEAETIRAIGEGWRTTAAIAPMITTPPNIKNPALCNRLSKLEDMGLVRRRPVDGKHFEWSVIKVRARKAG